MFVISQVKLNPTTREALAASLQARGDSRRIEDVVDEALKLWLQNAACDDPAAAQTAARGYLWKSLFLPDGTLLRFSYRHETYHAQVMGDHIVYRGGVYSPRQLLLHVTGSVRNAWRELYLRCPGDSRWHLADTRRHILRRTPRGRHLRGIDTDQVNADARAHLAARRAAGDADAFNELAGYCIGNSLEALVRLRAVLYRDDVVRSDQPDLSNQRSGAFRGGAGRAGPRDRRWINQRYHYPPDHPFLNGAVPVPVPIPP